MACSTRREQKNAYRILVENPEGKVSLARTRCSWEDIIENNLTEI
jgi:hypothetical protein